LHLNKLFLYMLVLLLSCSKGEKEPIQKFKLNDFEFPGTDKNKNGVSDEVEETLLKSHKNELTRKACFLYIQSEYELLSKDDISKSREIFTQHEENEECLTFLTHFTIDNSALYTCVTTVKDKMIMNSKQMRRRSRLIHNQLLTNYENLLISGGTPLDSAKYCRFYIPDFDSKLEEFVKKKFGEISNENYTKIRTAINHNNKYRPGEN
jgi:hypothetical protein